MEEIAPMIFKAYGQLFVGDQNLIRGLKREGYGFFFPYFLSNHFSQ
jgi:hypothetical protein